MHDTRYWLRGQRCIHTMISVSCKQSGSTTRPHHGINAFFLQAMIIPGVQKIFYNLLSRIWNYVLRRRSVSISLSRSLPCIKTRLSKELIDSYLNGERTLSNDRLSYLVFSSSSSSPSSSCNDDDNPQTNFDLLICAAHWIGDGMALHTFANELFHLLSHHASSELELMILLKQEFKRLYSDHARQVSSKREAPTFLIHL